MKAHLKHEAKKETENQDVADECFSFHDGSQTSALSCDEAELQTSAQELAEREPLGHGTKTKRRCRTVHRNPDAQQDHSAIKVGDRTKFQNQEKQENQDLRTVAEVPSPPEESQGEENAVSSGKRIGMPNKCKQNETLRF